MENSPAHKKNVSPGSTAWSIFLLLVAVQFSVSFILTAALPADEHSFLFGLSPLRILLLGGQLALAASSALLAWHTWRRGLPSILTRQGWQDALFATGCLTAFIVPLLLSALYALSRQVDNYQYLAYAERLRPLLLAAGLTGLELAALLAWHRRSQLGALSSALRSLRTPWLISTIAGLVVFLVIFLTRIGLEPESTGSWGLPAVPFLEWQILLVWAGTLAGTLLMAARRKTLPARTDLVVTILIWAAAAVLWLSQPVNPGFFATAPRPPAFAIYPFSDGMTYAINAQSILAGVTWQGEIVARPLYVTLLAGMHALAGQDYTRVIAIQTLILAAFPALLYLIGKEMGSRPLGLAAAALTILRDITANQSAPFTNNLTYSKLYFSELPTALLLSLAVYLALLWLKRSLVQPALPLAYGGVIGLAMLIRTQSSIALPVLLLIGLLHRPRLWRRWLAGSLLALLGTVLAVTPWLVHNARLTGGIIFDHPASQTLVLAQRYNGMNFDDPIPRQPEETLSAYSSRLMSMAVQGFAANPGTSLRMAGGHWLNNFIDNLLILPLRTGLESPSELLRPTRAFWQDWDGHPTAAQGVTLGGYLLLFTTGVATAWRLRRWVGLIPLAVNLSYNLWTGLFLSSGGRFLVPVDWGFYLYLVLGLLTLGMVLVRLVPKFDALFSHHQSDTENHLETKMVFNKASQFIKLVVIAGLIFLCGVSVPWSETSVPNRYLPISDSQTRQVYSKAVAKLSEPQASLLNALASDPGVDIQYGRAIYPRYYAAGEGEPETAKTGYAPEPHARLVFHFLGTDNHLVVFYLDQVPIFFPHIADAFLFYRQGEDPLTPQAVLVTNGEQSVFYTGTVQPEQEE